MKFYYTVTTGEGCGEVYVRASSLAKAKKLVQGHECWRIGKFDSKNHCVAATSPQWIQLVKSYNYGTDCEIFTKQFLKSRIAK